MKLAVLRQQSCPPILFLPEEHHGFLQVRASGVLVANKAALADCQSWGGHSGTLGGWAQAKHVQSAKVNIHWTGDGARVSEVLSTGD